MRVDLHIHTTASDGAWAPEAVVRGAAAAGLDVIAITDHDTAAGVAQAQAVAHEARVQVIPGIEVSSTHRGSDVHILGYFIDPEAPALRAHHQRAVGRRTDRMHEMIGRLRTTGVEVTFDDVMEAAGPDHVSIGRPHLARALVARGYAASVAEAFVSLIGDNAPAYVPTRLLEPADAVRLVVDAGGIAIWAHPPAELVDELLPALVAEGLRGLEVYRPSHRSHDVLRYETICRERGLLMSGGSDWHTPEGGNRLGDFFVEAREIEALLAEGGL